MVKRLTILALTALIFFSASLKAEYRPGLTITEQDGWPSGTPAKLKFSNGTVTDNFDGSFSITNSGGGGGGGTWGSITGTLSAQTDLQAALDAKVDENAAITGATKTKITYDAKGLVTAGADATTADINDSTDRRYVTDAQQTVITNTSGTNTGDVTLSGTPDYITIAGQTITRGLVDLAADVTGLLPSANVTPAGSNGELQYNWGGVLTANPNLIFDNTSILQIGGATPGGLYVADGTQETLITANYARFENSFGFTAEIWANPIAGVNTTFFLPPTDGSSGQFLTTDGAGSTSWANAPLPGANSITDSMLRQSAGLSVIGRSANTTGNVADITAASDNQVLRRSGTTLGFGTVATAGIANSAVTNAKLANMAANTVKVNATTGSAAPTDLALSASTVLGRGSSGNIVGLTAGSNISIGASSISATPAGIDGRVQVNNAGAFGSDAAFTYDFSGGLTLGGPAISGSLQIVDNGNNVTLLDANGLLLTNGTGTFSTSLSVASSLSANTTFRYPATNGSSGQFLTTDGAGNTSWGSPAAPSANSITDSMLRQSAGLSVIGRSANTTGNVADITAVNDGEVLRRSGTAIGFGTVATAGITDDAISNAKLSDMAANTVKVNATASSDNPTDLALSASTVLGRGSTGNIAAITAGANISFDGTNLIGINSTRTDTGTTVTVASTDRVIIWNGTAAGTANLPNASLSSSQNRVITIHNITTAYDLTIDPNSSQTIRGQSTLLLTPVSSISFVSDGTNWVVVAEPVSAFRSYTPTLGAGFGTTTEGLFGWRRIGDSMQIKGSFRCGTTGAGSTATITIPTGYTVDAAKVVGGTNGLVGVASRAINGAAANSSPLNVAYSGSNLYIASRSGGANITADTVSTVFSTSDRVSFDVTIPITGW